LGAGRERKEDAVQFGAGVVLNVQIGSRIEAGQPLMTLFTDTEEKFARAIELAGGAVEISSSSVAQRKLILGRIS
jgi:thymidine phosphorylase